MTFPIRSGLITPPPDLVDRLTAGVEYILTGEASGTGITSVSLVPSGVPVPLQRTATRIAIAWLSSNIPSGDWTATLERRPSGGLWSSVATFVFSVS